MAKMGAHLTKLDKGCTLTVTVNITRRLRLRIFLAKWLIHLAGHVLGCSADVQEQTNAE
jgi:hypothetical protein